MKRQKIVKTITGKVVVDRYKYHPGDIIWGYGQVFNLGNPWVNGDGNPVQYAYVKPLTELPTTSQIMTRAWQVARQINGEKPRLAFSEASRIAWYEVKMMTTNTRSDVRFVPVKFEYTSAQIIVSSNNVTRLNNGCDANKLGLPARWVGLTHPYTCDRNRCTEFTNRPLSDINVHEVNKNRPLVAIGDEDGRVTVGDLETNKIVSVVEINSYIQNLSWSDDGQLVVCTEDGDIQVIRDGKIIKTASHPGVTDARLLNDVLVTVATRKCGSEVGVWRTDDEPHFITLNEKVNSIDFINKENLAIVDANLILYTVGVADGKIRTWKKLTASIGGLIKHVQVNRAALLLSITDIQHGQRMIVDLLSGGDAMVRYNPKDKV